MGRWNHQIWGAGEYCKTEERRLRLDRIDTFSNGNFFLVEKVRIHSLERSHCSTWEMRNCWEWKWDPPKTNAKGNWIKQRKA